MKYNTNNLRIYNNNNNTIIYIYTKNLQIITPTIYFFFLKKLEIFLVLDFLKTTLMKLLL